MDPLRASRVAIFRERFRYFCSPECRERYDPEALRTPLPAARRRSAAEVITGSIGEREALARHQAAAALEHVGSDNVGLEPLPRTPKS